MAKEPTKINVYTLGQHGINRVKSPVHALDGELLSCQNANVRPNKAQLALSKRDGMAKINATAAAGRLLTISNIPLTDPSLSGTVIPNFSGWTQRTAPIGQWTSVTWSPDISLFTAVASDGAANRIMTSPDGLTWTVRTHPSNAEWQDVVWSPALNLFVAVGGYNSGSVPATDLVMTSPDGVTWTKRTAPLHVDWNCVAWSPALGLFAAGNSSVFSSDGFMTSADGTTWTKVGGSSSATGTWASIAWSPSLGLFAAVNSQSISQQVATSANGSTWTFRTTANNSTWRDIAWNATLGLFCAVASANTVGATRVMTSSDGITWTARTSADESLPWSTVVAAGGYFVAVAQQNGITSVMSSPDGINWTLQATPNAGVTWTSVTWSESLNRFAAVANTIAVDPVMTSP